MIPYEFIPQAYMVGGSDAIEPMYTFYPQAERLFPILPDTFNALNDSPAGSWGLAWFFGYTNGLPNFQVRDDVVLNSKIAWHESGHAFEHIVTQKLMAKGKSPSYFRDRYWEFRGFRGTWQEQYEFSLTLGTSGGWQWLPGESVAEAFSAAVGGIVESEWTFSDGKELATYFSNGNYDPYLGAIKAREFFTNISKEAVDDVSLSPDQDLMLRRILAILEAREPLVWEARAQRLLDVETGKPYNPNLGPQDPRIKQ
jgi:hypothetical protein